MTNKAILYSSPDCELSDALGEELLCTSPEAGGNEDVGYDDWVI